jgi:hypothetical protein
MARPLKQSTSADVPIGPFVDATDGITAETGLTLTQPDIRLKKNAAAWAQKAAAQTLTHEENGFYEVTLDATDTDTLGLLRLAVFESGAAPVWEDFVVLPANVYDSMFSTDKLQVDVVEIAGSTVSTSSAQLGVNVVNAGATAWGSGAITAASIASDAIAAAKIATGAITAAKFAAGAIDAAAIADNAIDAGAIAANAITSAKIATGAITTAAFAAGAIDAAAIAANAIGASELAADAATEIAAAVLAAATAAPIAADIQAVNAVAIVGDGAGTPWGP